MDQFEISYLRLVNQQLTTSEPGSVKDLSGWMGAIQAQDFNMVKWAIGVRLPGITEKSVISAIDNGDLIRTHVLRPTWHFVSPENLHWMLDLTGDRIRSVMKTNDRHLELTDYIFDKCNAIIEQALSGGVHLSREELIRILNMAGIVTDANRASHILMHAELDRLICSGKIINRKQSYVLMRHRIPLPKPISREEALFNLARMYFTSHGPATLEDFIWWSGLAVAAAKQAVELVKDSFVSETFDDRKYLFPGSVQIPDHVMNSTYLLPAYDEFVISYRDRTASLPFQDQSKAFTNNGIFKPVIVMDGQVVGIWKRTIKGDEVLIETDSFVKPWKGFNERIEMAATLYGKFLEKNVVCRHSQHK